MAEQDAERKIASGRQYIVGHRDIGIIMMSDSKRFGMRVLKVSKEEIDAYADAHGILPDLVFARIARVLAFISTITDARHPLIDRKDDGKDPKKASTLDDADYASVQTGEAVLAGAKVTHADFCFVTKFNEENYEIGRHSARAGILLNSINKFFPDQDAASATVIIDAKLLDDFGPHDVRGT